jgi:hypothetical protein
MFDGSAIAGSEHGTFLDELNARFLDDGRKIQLLDDFRFLDPSDIEWKAERGFVSDGASIPRSLWTIVGGPLDGKYRRASIIHDKYCEIRTRSWKDTHRVFYFGMRASGVSESKARTMYFAVLIGGPRWGLVNGAITYIVPEYSIVELGKARQIRIKIENDQSVGYREIEGIALEFSAQKFPYELRH